MKQIINKTMEKQYEGRLYKYIESIFGPKIIMFQDLGTWVGCGEVRCDQKIETEKQFEDVVKELHSTY